MIQSLLVYFNDLSVFGKIAIVLNASLFFIAGFLFNKVVPTSNTSLNKRRTNWLRVINLVLISVYLIDWLINYYFSNKGHNELFTSISQTGLVLLLAYLFTQFSHTWTVKRFGKERTVDDVTSKIRTYQSEMGYIIILFFSIIISLLLLINIWDVTSWLQATGVIGGLLVILFATKEAWAHDAVNGLILMYNGDVSPGVVCRISELDLLAVVRKMSLTQTTFYDVIQKHNIIIANSRLRSCKIEILNKSDTSHWNDFVEFNIGYKTPSLKVEQYVQAVWLQACEIEKQLDSEKPPKLVLVKPADHAIIWRINYRVESVFRIKQARFAINRAAFDLQAEFDVTLATPFTHAQSSDI
ncbi:MAG: hypothetical protein L3J52_04825 [Proteobacteria bacterium]|nr:hypothetical protein [Pseudomonadota bacterium]